MWEKYFKENLGTVRKHDKKRTCLEKQIESTLIIFASDGWHETKHASISANAYINVSSELMVEYVDSIGDMNWWLANGLSIWETLVRKIGGKVREGLLETRKEIKVDIFVSQFTELVRYFDIIIGESIQIKTDYKLWFMGKIVNLEDTFLNISDDIHYHVPLDI
jgi:hypothetical protein